MTTSLANLVLLCAPLIHPLTLGALIDVESGGNPYAVSVNYPQTMAALGRPVPQIANQPKSLNQAVRLVEWLSAHHFSASLGLAQISTEHRQEFGLSYAAIFDPCTNLRLAQRILIRCSRQVGAVTASGLRRSGAFRIPQTLSCYNSGNESLGLRNGYVAAVIATARKLSVHF